MSETQKLQAQPRTDFGKGAARQARRDGLIPAVVYGHGSEPAHVLLPGKATTLAVRTANAVLSLDVDGQEKLVLVKDIQRHPLRQTVDHLDLLIVRRGEKVNVEVAVHTEGEVFSGLALNLDVPNVALVADALRVPESIVVDVEGMKEGHVTAADLKLPAGSELDVDPETVIITVAEPQEQDLPEPEDAEGEAEGTTEEAPADEAE